MGFNKIMLSLVFIKFRIIMKKLKKIFINHTAF